MMPKLVKILATVSTAVLVGGFAAANVDRSMELQSEARQDASVTLAVAPSHPIEIKEDPTVDLAPALPSTPPMPQRSPRIPLIDLASAESTPLIEQEAVIGRIAAVRAAPSADAPALYDFPPGRELRVVARKDGFVQVEDVRSGADGWVEQSALASNMMTASVEPKAPVRQAKAEIKSPKPVTGIPKEERYTPMLLGGVEAKTAVVRQASSTNFASFVRRGLGAN